MLKDNRKYIQFFDAMQEVTNNQFVSFCIEDKHNRFFNDSSDIEILTDGIIRKAESDKKEVIGFTYIIEKNTFFSLEGVYKTHYSLYVNRKVNLANLSEIIGEKYKEVHLVS